MLKKNSENNEKKGFRIVANRKRIAVLGTIAIGLIFTILVAYAFLVSIITNYESDMRAAVEYGRLEYNHNIEKNDIYFKSDKEALIDITAFTAFVYEENGYSSDIRDELLADVGKYSAYYFFRGSVDKDRGTVDGYMNRESRGYQFPELTNEQLFTLFTKGFLDEEDGNYMTAAPVSNQGYVILEWGLENILKEQSVLEAYSDKREISVIRLDMETGTIGDSTDAGIIGKEYKEIITQDTINKIQPDKESFEYLADGSRAVFLRDEEDDGQIFCAYIKIADFLPDVIRCMSLPVILGWMFLIIVLIYALRFARVQEENDDGVEYLHIIGNIYADKMLMQHVISIAGFAIILIITSMLYVQTLINYSDQNVKATNNLQTLDAIITLNDENSHLIKEDFAEVRGILIDDISKYYMRYPDQLSAESLTRLCDKMPITYAIAFFDKNGDVEYDTQGEVGYSLSKDETLSEYKCWDIINGLCDRVSFTRSNYEEAYVASRRQDKPGLILITQSAPYIDEFDKLTAMDSVLASAYFGTAAKAYIKIDDDKNLYWMEPGDTVAEKKANVLTEAMMQNGFAGISRIGGNRYYINTRVREDLSYVLVSAKNLNELFGMYSSRVIVEIVIAFILQLILVILLSSHRFRHKRPEKIEIINNRFIMQSLDEQMMDEKFRNVIRNMLLATCVMIAALLIFDSFYGKTSLLSYLFASQWSRGVNMFSITMILILAAMVIIGGGILQILIAFFTKNMGPRGVTVGRMANSLIKFVVLIVIIVNVLLDLGAKSGTLLAGAGVFGVAFSLFAQQTLNDFLSGFFIVFEGIFNIGDWITVGDFRGQVIEIGIRTTKIAIGGDIKIINNSELKQVTVMARNGMGARVCVDVAYKEDVDAVISLIENNRSRYQNEMPFMLEGPYVDGVIGLGDSGVTLRLWALADQEKIRAVERGVLRITKSILDENNIEIPFNQVTIHNAD